jgi:hypothetical protein
MIVPDGRVGEPAAGDARVDQVNVYGIALAQEMDGHERARESAAHNDGAESVG